MARKQKLLTFTEAQYVDLEERAMQNNLTLNEYIMRLLFPNQQPVYQFQFFFDLIAKEVAKLAVGEEYALKELLGVAWRKVPRNMGGQLGKAYKQLVENGEVNNVIYVRLNRENNAVYRKVRGEETNEN